MACDHANCPPSHHHSIFLSHSVLHSNYMYLPLFHIRALILSSIARQAIYKAWYTCTSVQRVFIIGENFRQLAVTLVLYTSSHMQGDGRYLISNSKDQSIKLWDMRKFSTARGEQATLDKVRLQMWDYRWENVPRSAQKNVMTKLRGDTSVMTYAGHIVKNTLLRCRFSPMYTTGQVSNCYDYVLIHFMTKVEDTCIQWNCDEIWLLMLSFVLYFCWELKVVDENLNYKGTSMCVCIESIRILGSVLFVQCSL